jgi:hypothetical protein
MGRDGRRTRVDTRSGSRARQLLAVAALIALLAIAILALAGARRTVLGQEPRACGEAGAPIGYGLVRC